MGIVVSVAATWWTCHRGASLVASSTTRGEVTEIQGVLLETLSWSLMGDVAVMSC